jgi:hypothetical protein
MVSKKLGFNAEDTITAQFCGTKKSQFMEPYFRKIFLWHNAANYWNSGINAFSWNSNFVISNYSRKKSKRGSLTSSRIDFS